MIYITGDTHGSFIRFNMSHFPEQLKMCKEDYVIVTGDFGGVWDRFHSSEEEAIVLDWLEALPFTLLFIDGNHENFDRINDYPVEEWNGGKVHKIRPSVIHLMRGQIFIISGKTIFTFGGAQSHDVAGGILDPEDPEYQEKKRAIGRGTLPYRIKHFSWWEQELPTEEEMQEGLANLAKYDYEVDYIVTHCGSTKMQETVLEHNLNAHQYATNVLTEYLEKIRRTVKFNKWVFGHYHDNRAFTKYILVYDEIIRLDDDLEEMLACFRTGGYRGMRELGTTLEDLSEAHVFMPETIYELFDHITIPAVMDEEQRCLIEVWQTDTLTAAKKLVDSGCLSVTALVFGHPTSPGGSIKTLRRGDIAQEENLAANTSLLISQESPIARPYYEFHRQTNSFQASDAVLFSPNVLIVDKAQNKVTHKISCATSVAPMCSVFTKRLEGMSDAGMDRIWLQRWTSLLVTLANLKCKTLILGAWGCGAFSNSTQRVAATLKKVLENNMQMFFERIVVAVPEQENYEIFHRSLSDML